MAQLGFGTKIQVDDGASSAFVDLVEVTSITVPTGEDGRVEYSHLGQVGRGKLYLPGLKEPGEVTVEQNATEAELVRLNTIKAAATTKNWKVILPDGATFTFAGFISKMEVAADAGESIIKNRLSVAISGDVTVAAGP